MSESGWLADQFEHWRPHLASVAYGMLGSVTEAEDAVQQAWLRLDRSDADAIMDLRAWLTTVVGRICLDMLRARKAHRVEYVGAWLPEPLDMEPAADAGGGQEGRPSRADDRAAVRGLRQARHRQRHGRAAVRPPGGALGRARIHGVRGPDRRAGHGVRPGQAPAPGCAALAASTDGSGGGRRPGLRAAWAAPAAMAVGQWPEHVLAQGFLDTLCADASDAKAFS